MHYKPQLLIHIRIEIILQTSLWPPSPPVRAVLSAVRSGHRAPPSPPRFCPHRAELDAHRHNRWYSTTDRRSARISRRTTFLSQNFTGTSRIIGAGGGFTEDKLDFDGPWILRLEAEFGVWVSCDGFFFCVAVQLRESVKSKQNPEGNLEMRWHRLIVSCDQRI